MNTTFDLIVIGGGPAGLVSAKVAAGLGKKVVLIEKERLGGDCTLTGCIPSKTLIALSNKLFQAQSLKQFGLHISTIDTEKVMEAVRVRVEEIYQSHSPEKLAALGITVIYGVASVATPTSVLCSSPTGTTVYTARKIIIATGSRPCIPPLEGLDSVPCLTNKNLFSLKKLPKTLLILGGGPLGVELAQCLQRLGTAVTLIENYTFLPREDHELVPLVTQTLRNQGVTLHSGTRALKAFTTNKGIALTCQDTNGNTLQVEAEDLLVAVGRLPNYEKLGLEAVGVETTCKGITVDSTLKTTVPTIYACGDIVGPYLFNHMAHYQATIAAHNALIPFFKRSVDYHQAVWVTFTDPELASTGLTEEAARVLYGDKLLIYRSYYKDYDRPRTDSQTIGMSKIICAPDGSLIGAHIYGERAGEMIGELRFAAYYKHPFSALSAVVHPYPTYSDLIWQPSHRAAIERHKKSWLHKILKSIA